MAGLNQAKVMKDLEAVIAGGKEDFIYGFLQAYKFSSVTVKRLRNGEKQRNAARIAGDIALANKLYFRAVTDGSTLENVMEEIKNLPLIEAEKIRFIMVTDFQRIYAYDKKVQDCTEFDYADLPVNYEFFLPLTGEYEKALSYTEHPADVKACEKMGSLYDRIRTINHYEKQELHALNIFLTRLLFCFFAEDTGIFPLSQQMTNAVTANTLEDGSDTAVFFENLFSILDLPENAPERKTFAKTFQKFPYVNGTLFREKITVPQFDKRARSLLLDCGKMNWSDISPVIFGSMFQAVMDQEQRRNLGAHYTSEKNIFKVIRPLFLDDLEEELEKILAGQKGKAKEKALKEFHQKLYSLGFLDPACGCGNFLIVSYRELRLLELRVLLALKELNPQESQLIDIKFMQKVSIEQFYGMELEEFPVDIARVSLFLMDHVMNLKCAEAFGQTYPTIPLKHSAAIVCTNALTTPWESIIPPEKISFIFGNPPFVGSSTMTKEQKAEIMAIFNKRTGAGKLDYVTAWYEKSSLYMQNNQNIHCSFVSTNSICQGEQVAYFWAEILKRKIKINFAHQTFQWSNEAKNNAAVYCIIVGFSYINSLKKKLFSYVTIKSEPVMQLVENINPYLIAAKDIVVKPINEVLTKQIEMVRGNQPTDGGNLIIEANGYEQFITKEPEAKPYIKKFIGAEEFLHNKQRYCLWLVNAPQEILELPEIKERILACYQMRLNSVDIGCRKLANRPHLFRDINNPQSALLIPRVSSERRKYIPIGYIHQNTIISDSCHTIPNATLYDFAILTSAMHMVWVRTVCGRLKSDYRYSRDLCYNTFPFPNPTKQQKEQLSKLAEDILLMRETYPHLTLADMYDPDKMPEDLKEAHHKLDLAVDSLYQKKPFENDDERLQLLFNLYEKLTQENSKTTARRKRTEEETEEE